MDTLSDVLRAVRLSGAVFFDVDASEPWVAEAPPGSQIVDRIFDGAEHLMSYHVMTRGTCWASLVGEPPVQLQPGDVIVFPHGDPHIMASRPGMRGAPSLDLYERRDDRARPFTLTMGPAHRDPVHLVCGFLGCDARPFNPLLSALPRLLHQPARAGGVVAEFVRMAVEESAKPRVGSETLLGRLSELLFIDVVRHHLESLPEDRTTWLSGLRDPHVGRALAALHASPARPWTIEQLARESGLSRSAFAERFVSFAGLPPMQYLANWRMQLAAHQLLDGRRSVGDIAASVGYDSEAAFSRAFRKIVGVPPGAWRRLRNGRGAVSDGRVSPAAAGAAAS